LHHCNIALDRLCLCGALVRSLFDTISTWKSYLPAAAARVFLVLLLLRLSFHCCASTTHAIENLVFRGPRGAQDDTPAGCLGIFQRLFRHLKLLVNVTATIGLTHRAAGTGPWDYMFVALWGWALWQAGCALARQRDRPAFASHGIEGWIASSFASAMAKGVAERERRSKTS